MRCKEPPLLKASQANLRHPRHWGAPLPSSATLNHASVQKPTPRPELLCCFLRVLCGFTVSPQFAGRTRLFFWKSGSEGDKGRAGSAEPAAQNPGEDSFQEKARDQSEKETGYKAGERHSKTPSGPANLSEGDGAEACQSNHPEAAPCEPGPHFRHSGRPPAQQAAQDRTQKPCANRVPKRGSSRSRKSRENCRLTGRNAD